MILQPPSVLQAGPSGSGKTSTIATQLMHGLEVFVVVTEPDGVSSLLDACERLNAPIDQLHWSLCAPGAAGWMDLEDMITKISSMDQKQLADQRDMGKSSFRAPAVKFLNAFRDFTCDRTGQSFGDFTKWDDSRSLNVDSLTGWSMIGWGCTVGFKPTANPGEWGIAQNFVQNMLIKINSDRQCFFSLTAHVEKEMDEMLGVKKIMVSTIGAKLAPKIPIMFGDVVKTSRVIENGKPKYYWSTFDDSMDLKNRALPMSAKLDADFGPIISAYRRRVQMAGGGQARSATSSTASQNTAGPSSPPAAPSKAYTQGVLPPAPLTPTKVT